jgi:nucleoside-diphosphate-sugar epimerase
MNILVTGATGFIGSHLVEQLLNQKHQVFALVRKTSNVGPLIDKGVNLIYGDISDKDSLRVVCDYDIEAVFHCAGYVQDDNWKSLYHINVIGTENICNLCLKLKVERLVYVSSVAVVNGNSQITLQENLPFNATNLYGASKIDAEGRVIEFRKKGLRAAIIRPPMVYGEGEPHALGKILFLLRHRLLPIIGQGKARWHLAYVKNVADALILALHKDEFLQDTFFVADEEALTVKEILLTLIQAIEAPNPYYLPSWVTPLFRKLPYLGKRLNFLCKDRIYDISRIQAAGYKPHYQTKNALSASALHWLKEEGK